MRLYFLMLLTLLLNAVSHSQVTDAVYIRSAEKRTLINDAFATKHLFAPEKANINAEALSTDIYLAQSPPLDFGDCILLSAASHAFNSSGEFALFGSDTLGMQTPPSLRFYVNDSAGTVDLYGRLKLFGRISRLTYARTFWMKKTEVTNKEYREFVAYVKDSIARRALSEGGFDEEYLLSEKEYMKKYNLTPDQIDSAYPQLPPLNWSTKVDWNSSSPDYRAALEYIYLPPGERFYKREIDTRKLLYEFFYETDGKKIKEVVNVYPDTTCWIKDFPNNIAAESFSNMYFWHPYFDNYPVVGINYYQTRAFLNWKTKAEFQKKSKSTLKWKAIYSLPTEIEWEAAVTALRSDKNIVVYPYNYTSRADYSWYCDLQLRPLASLMIKHRELIDSFKTFTVKRPSYGYGDNSNVVDGYYNPDGIEFEDTTFTKGDTTFTTTYKYRVWHGPSPDPLNETTYRSENANTNYPFCAPADLVALPNKTKRHQHPAKEFTYIDNSELKTHISATGFSWLDGNVSEWINADFSKWHKALQLKQKQLLSINNESGRLASALITAYTKADGKDDKLIRGANWYDSANANGAQAKCFADPLAAFSTVGFRYVIHVTKIN